jgi:predicted RNA-binding Zn-ribbon protein involved in translation (DUF1610 family)
MSEEQKTMYPCKNCGGNLEFKPGETKMICPYCGTENEIVIDESKSEMAVEEKDYTEFLSQAVENTETIEKLAVECGACKAIVTLEENKTAGDCPFCGTPVVAEAQSVKLIKPQSLLPFSIDKREAAENFKVWLKKLWFAPNKLKKYARPDGFKGVYLPFWTYDTEVDTDYVGQRGEYYYVTETYTTTEDNETVTKTREVRKTRWYPASGEVHNSFDDILVPAASDLPEDKLRELEPWDLQNLVPYDSKFVAGLGMQSYTIDLAGGFAKAQDYVQGDIEDKIRRHIGGDEQRILRMSPDFHDITFKHILLPVWLAAYKFNKKVYQVIVNARTGEVQGQRPWSVIKIVLTILLVLIVIGAIVFALNYFGLLEG